MSEVTYPPVQQAMKKLQALSRNEEDRYRAIARERALYNELTLLRDAREEGREEGLRDGVKKGVEEGLALAKAATLTRQLTRRFGPLPEWAVLRVQQAPPVELDAWLDRIFDAPTLQAALDGP